MVALVSSHNIFLSCVSLAKKEKKNNKLTLQNEEETTETSVAPSPRCYYHHHYYYHCCSAQKEFVAADLHVLNRTVTWYACRPAGCQQESVCHAIVKLLAVGDDRSYLFFRFYYFFNALASSLYNVGSGRGSPRLHFLFVIVVSFPLMSVSLSQCPLWNPSVVLPCETASSTLTGGMDGPLDLHQWSGYVAARLLALFYEFLCLTWRV